MIPEGNPPEADSIILAIAFAIAITSNTSKRDDDNNSEVMKPIGVAAIELIHIYVALLMCCYVACLTWASTTYYL